MKKLVTTCFLASSLALTAGACGGGDDDDDGGNEVDSGPEVDARPPTVINRSATIAIAQNALLNNLGEPFNGATVSGGWNDPTTDVAPVPGFENNLNSCALTIYDFGAGDELPETIDEGVVSVGGTANGDFACAYSPVTASGRPGYMCQKADAAAQGVVAVDSIANPEGDDSVTYTFLGATFDASYVGTYINVSGFPNVAANGTFPVIGFDDGAPAQLVVGNANLLAASTVVTAGTYATVVGAGPVPGGFQFLPVEDDVLTPITVSKPETDMVGALEFTADDAITPAGFGFQLDDASADPMAFPTTAEAQTYSCAGAGGDCGPAGSLPIDVITISGEASDGDISEASPVSLGANPTKYASFSCSFLGLDNGATLSQEAVAAILAIDPTRVRIAVGHFSGTQVFSNEGESRSNVLAGHMVTGFTTLVAP